MSFPISLSSQMKKVDLQDIFSHASEMMLFQRLLQREAEPEIATEITALWMWFQTEGHGEKLTSKISENKDEEFFSSLVVESMAMLAILDPSTKVPFSPDLFPTCSALLSPSLDALSEIFNDSKETVSKGIDSLCNELIFHAFNDFENEKRHTPDPEDGDAEEEEEEKEEEEEEENDEEEEQNPTEVHDSGEEVSSEDDSNEPFALNPYAEEWSPVAAPEESRCLFLTFSNGYPLTEQQNHNLLHQKVRAVYSDGYIHRPENSSRPPLFGKVVFTAVSIVAMVLGGEDDAKFVINRRPLWCKKYYFPENSSGCCAAGELISRSGGTKNTVCMVFNYEG